VVQIYVGERHPSVPRPKRELKRFARVRLAAGERRDVAVELDRDAFTYYDTEKGWTVSPGTFEITVGRSSRDIRGEVSIEVE
jgi:beta-glucosidase